MQFVKDLLSTLLSMLLSTIFSAIIFAGLNKGVLQMFVRAQRFTSGLKRKENYKLIVFITFVILSVIMKYAFDFNYIGLGATIGIFYSLTDIIFKSPAA